MKEKGPQHIATLRRTYIVTSATEVVLSGLAMAVLAASVVSWFLKPEKLFPYITLALGVVVVFVFVVRRVRRIDDRQVIRYINHQYPEMEDSTDLLLSPADTLPVLQQLQLEKISKRFENIYPTVRFPHRIGSAIVALAAATGFAWMVFALSPVSETAFENQQDISFTQHLPAPEMPPGVEKFRITVTPPAYTRLKTASTGNPHLNVPEGSSVSWTISFSARTDTVHLVFAGEKPILLKGNEDRFSITRTIAHSNLYHFSWVTGGGQRQQSDYYKLGVIEDQAPEIEVSEPARFTELNYDDDLTLNVHASLNDDYGLSEASVIATVSKGSGESVKFREEKLAFASPTTISGKQVNASLTLDLNKLGLEPGDEIYFYVEAFDNKTPARNRARSETCFVQLRDTARHVLSVDGGLGVDLMPEYFRSQRQIIIDSEKLLRERKAITREEFNARANELGYDQKVLRLRYGQFLGEEFETAIGEGAHVESGDHEPHHDHDEDHDDDPTAAWRHNHDTDNEHNLVPQHHHHGIDENTGEEKKEDPWEAYKHVHDDPEEATFFSQSIRAKLKAALTVMWDAELHLRLFDPETSLPYQYQALTLLKEISNDSRIYVHKTGFDPPPLKEDKRLTGDLSEVHTGHHRANAFVNKQYPALRAGLRLTETALREKKTTLTENDKHVLREAGQELAQLALEHPGFYLETLSLIRRVTTEAADSASLPDHLRAIQRAFWKAIPVENQTPQAAPGNLHPLDSAFIHQLHPQP